MVPQRLRMIIGGAGIIIGGLVSVNIASSLAIGTLRFAVTRRKVKLTCGVCRGKGFYICRLCKGNSTIEWSPLYDPIFINPCLCPTCDGNRVQRCLNCLGKGYT